MKILTKYIAIENIPVRFGGQSEGEISDNFVIDLSDLYN